jgi:hypothetical protein
VFFSHNKPANSSFSTINQRNEQAARWQLKYYAAEENLEEIPGKEHDANQAILFIPMHDAEYEKVTETSDFIL